LLEEISGRETVVVVMNGGLKCLGVGGSHGGYDLRLRLVVFPVSGSSGIQPCGVRQMRGQVQISVVLSRAPVFGWVIEFICLQLIEYQCYYSGGF